MSDDELFASLMDEIKKQEQEAESQKKEAEKLAKEIELEEKFDMSVKDLSEATEKLVLGLVERHQPGNTRKVPPSVMKELMKDNDDLSLLKMSKNLVDPKCFEKWTTFYNKAYSIMTYNPFYRSKDDVEADKVTAVLGIKGVQLMTRSRAIRVAKELDKLIEEANKVADEISENWDAMIAEAKPILEAQGLYNEADYPKSIRSKFSISYRFYNIGMANAFANFDQAFYEQEQKKWEETMANARAESLMFWRDATQTVLDDAVEVLDGKKQVIRSEKIEKFKKLQKFFEEEKLYDDNDLKKIIDKCIEVMSGVDAGMLRDSETLRIEKLNKLSRIKDILVDNTTKLKRSIILDD